jgi:hypothetical protein
MSKHLALAIERGVLVFTSTQKTKRSDTVRGAWWASPTDSRTSRASDYADYSRPTDSREPKVHSRTSGQGESISDASKVKSGDRLFPALKQAHLGPRPLTTRPRKNACSHLESVEAHFSRCLRVRRIRTTRRPLPISRSAVASHWAMSVALSLSCYFLSRRVTMRQKYR